MEKQQKDLAEALKRYVPYNEQEARDREVLLSLLESGQELWTRDNPVAHITASAWVTNCTHDKILMAYHKIYQSWSWLGGHADGDRDLLYVAQKEAMEESGVTVVTPVDTDIFSIEILTVDGHEKKGSYVASHLHLNITYLLEADEEEVLHIREEENTGVAWFTLDTCVDASSEPWMRDRIYQKLVEKLAHYR